MFDFGSGPVPAHQHKDGGGWVAETARVEDTAYVGPDACVFGNACVFGFVCISCKAQVFGNAHVSGNACVYGNAHISGKARIFGSAQVSGNARIYDDAQVSGKVIKDFIPKSPIPILPDLDAKILKAIDQEGCSLKMSNWHTCKTTHCRAEWAVHLGDAYALEQEVGPWLAGALIYQASTGRIPNFFMSTEDTLRDLSKGLR